MFELELFNSQIGEAVEEFADELSRIKGWNFKSILNAVGMVVTALPIMVPMLAIAPPEERRKAIVDAINKHIDVRWIPEAIERLAIAWIYDAVAKRIFVGL